MIISSRLLVFLQSFLDIVCFLLFNLPLNYISLFFEVIVINKQFHMWKLCFKLYQGVGGGDRGRYYHIVFLITSFFWSFCLLLTICKKFRKYLRTWVCHAKLPICPRFVPQKMTSYNSVKRKMSYLQRFLQKLSCGFCKSTSSCKKYCWHKSEEINRYDTHYLRNPLIPLTIEFFWRNWNIMSFGQKLLDDLDLTLKNEL